MSANPTQNKLSQAHITWRRFRQETQSWPTLRNGAFNISSSRPPTGWRSEWHPSAWQASIRIDDQDQSSDADTEFSFKPHCSPGIERENHNKKLAPESRVYILEN